MEHRKNRHKKNKALVIILIILAALAVIVTGCFLYLTPDQAAKAQYKEEVAVLTQEITDKRLSQLGEATAGILTATGNAGTPAEDVENRQEEQPKDQESEPKADATDDAAQKAAADLEALKVGLIGVYDQIMLDMQDDGMALIDDLITQAKADYKQLKAEKKNNPAAVSKLATAYMSKGSAMEEQMDNSFDTITQAIAEQMNSLGIDPEPTISEYQNQYMQIKEQRQKALIDKALKVIQ